MRNAGCGPHTRSACPACPRPGPTPGTNVDALLAREVLVAQSAPHRAALTLRYLDGLPVPEVAAHLGRTVPATEALLGRARTAFRRDCRDRGLHIPGKEGSR